MSRLKLIQGAIDKGNFSNYLEIGCFKGKNFFKIKAKKKIAVDPSFKFKFYAKIPKAWISDPNERNNLYFQETSDQFFQNHDDLLKNLGTLDVVFVDGLHTFKASLSDVLNSLKYLNRNGLIVMHDCYPPHKAASVPTDHFPTEEEKKQIPNWTNEWCGDVWKSIVYLKKSFGDALDVSVVDSETGLGTVRITGEIPKGKLEIDSEIFSEVDKMTYEDLKENPEKIINLKDISYFEEVFSGIEKGS